MALGKAQRAHHTVSMIYLTSCSGSTYFRRSWRVHVHCSVSRSPSTRRKLLKRTSMTLETGIFLSQAIWLWRVRHVRREAKKLGMTYDEYTDANPSKKLARTESLETVADIEVGIDGDHPSNGCAFHSPGNIANPIGTSEDTVTIPEKVALSICERG